MTALSPDVIRAALTAVTGLVPRHPVILPPPPDDPLDLALPDEDLPDHDPLDDAEETP